MNFLANLIAMINAATAIIPIIAAAHKQADPTAKNTALDNASKLIQVVTPLVQAGETISAAGVAAGQPALTGVQKLAIAQDSLQKAHDMVQAVGGTTETFDSYWGQVSPVITAICAVNKVSAAPAALAVETA